MINDIRLQNFRSYEDMSFEFGDGVNIIVGPNGSGKTNLLEAIQVISVGSSYRVGDDELIRLSSEWFRLDANTYKGAEFRTLKYSSKPIRTKKYELDGDGYRKIEINKTIPVVVFEPNHLFLLHGSPDLRRLFIDEVLIKTIQNYDKHLLQYKKILKQRNALLKRGSVTKQEMFPWNLRLSELGAYIVRHRNDLVVQINNKLNDLYGELSRSDKKVAIEYISQFPVESYETHIMHALETKLENDIARGFTAYGPHRDDFVITFDGKPATEVASRGEIRTVVLSLKIMELTQTESSRGITPILLLDDVFSELDGTRRRALTAYLQRYQTFLTTTDADVVVKHFTNSTIIPLG